LMIKQYRESNIPFFVVKVVRKGWSKIVHSDVILGFASPMLT